MGWNFLSIFEIFNQKYFLKFKIGYGLPYCKALYQKEINFYQEMEIEHRSQENGKGLVPLSTKIFKQSLAPPWIV